MPSQRLAGIVYPDIPTGKLASFLVQAASKK
jgi:hypothetical protein